MGMGRQFEKKNESTAAQRMEGAQPIPDREYIKYIATTKNEFQNIYADHMKCSDQSVEIELNIMDIELNKIHVTASTLGNSPEFYFTMISADLTLQDFKSMIKDKLQELADEATRLRATL